jgi:serine phosphatase RsbU (regulator of sigma subunit)/pSer/pThr/pTyr-binding forkhead associated (FHA) protein
VSAPRLDVLDALGRREVPLDRLPFRIGRRETSDLQLRGSEVSREHAEILREGVDLVLRDLASRYGTFVNGDAVTEHRLRSGDRIRLGRGGGADLVFLTGDDRPASSSMGTRPARDELRMMTALLESVRALGSGRVLQDVLTLVLDAAIEISGAERAFIMLAEGDGDLEFRLGRSRQRQTLTDRTFATSRKIPEEVFRTGSPRAVTDLLDDELAGVHVGTVALGIRHVVCVPLNLVRYVESAEARGDDRRIGVLYLDSRERGQLLSTATRAGLETLAAEASVAIENARLYREKLERARLEQEMRIAAEIQQALLPQPRPSLGFAEAAGASLACRSIGGDFYDYLDLDGSAFGFTLGDVAGKGPPAALLSALMQGMLASEARIAHGPADAMTHLNQGLCRRGIESRFVTLVLGALATDGTLTYCNAGHGPPFVIGRAGIRRLDAGGPPVGLLPMARFEAGTLQLDPGDLVVVVSDGVSEAFSPAGEEFGDGRVLETVSAEAGLPVGAIVDRLIAAVRAFTEGAMQGDDITAMVIRYTGSDH